MVDAGPTGPLPLVSILLLTFNQRGTVAAALDAALRQTYARLDIVVSDDASTDDTFEVLQDVLRHRAARPGVRVRLHRNAVNLGIGGNLNRSVAQSTGELLFVAAGDDVSRPTRCEEVVRAWLASNRRLDLIAAALVDMDEEGGLHATIVPTDLSTYRDAADWIARPPHVVGAAQAWTRRVFDRFGPLPPAAMAEDMIMVLRAILSGGATTLNLPLVDYRRGGVSRRRRAQSAADVVTRLLRNNRHALVELPQLLSDAAQAGQLAAVQAPLQRRLQRELFIRELFGATTVRERWRALRQARGVAWTWRMRLLVYAACPGVLAPFFALKRLRTRP